jgi:2-hydroxy-3-keto-5-methylthiopentenyl-1-phosphate phosphatase
LIALPGWRCTCLELSIKPSLIPCDVVTQWNSTYGMMHFVITYRKVNQITTDKSLKLRNYELDNNEWVIVGDLVSVLEVSNPDSKYMSTDPLQYRATRKQHYFFQGFGEHCSCYPCYGQAQKPA